MQLLHSSPPEALIDFLKSLKERSAWLDGQQEIELKRMRTACNQGAAMLMLPSQPLAAHLTPMSPLEADEFATQVLTGAQGTTLAPQTQTPGLDSTPGTDGLAMEAALGHHQLQRDTVTPMNPAVLTEALTNSPIAKAKGMAQKGQAKLKRKRT